VIGLGAGVTVSYCRPGDFFSVYEINPLALGIATSWFTFLKDCSGDHQVLLGDARLTLESQPNQQYDVLSIDAFTSDAIPVHLLTREAFALYFRHLKPSGILAVHVSNRYLDLVPVVARNASDLGKKAIDVDWEDEEEDYLSTNDWVLVSGSSAARPPPVDGRLPQVVPDRQAQADERVIAVFASLAVRPGSEDSPAFRHF
jgi:hypothetical protein